MHVDAPLAAALKWNKRRKKNAYPEPTYGACGAVAWSTRSDILDAGLADGQVA